MADKNEISELDFNVEKALKSLDDVNEKLKTLETESLKYATNIGKNINDALQSVGNIDTKKIQSSMNEAVNVSKTTSDKIILDTVRANNKIRVQENDTLQYKERVETKKAASAEAANNRQIKSAKTLSDKITEYAKTFLIYQGFNQLKNVASQVIEEMVGVEEQMVSIDRVMENGLTNVDRYRYKLIQLAEDYGNTFSNVADITLKLAQAGFDEQESLALTEKTLLALNTADLNATQATSDMIAVMAQWGLMTGDATKEAEDYGAIIDKINKVADHFPTTSEDIMAALKKTSSAFNLAGASIDETIATIVAAEKASQRGGKEIGTALSNIIQQLKETKKIGIAEDLGISFYTDETKTEFKDIMTIFSELSAKMQQLKNDGKESSTEMQELLNIFTVFRRNIGASLLGEMAGEDSTYAKVLETSINSLGYSLEENTKYMSTAKAAQAQLNAELMKLKTEVWDGGLEQVYRNLLSTGKDMLSWLGDVIKDVGVLPATIGAVTLAVTALNTKVDVASIKTLITKIKEINVAIVASKNGLKATDDVLDGTSSSFKQYVANVGKGKVTLQGYTASLIASKAATVALTVASIALKAAISLALTAAVTALAKAIDEAAHAQEKFIEQQEELYSKAKESSDKYSEEKQNIKELREEYEKLAAKGDARTSDEDAKILEIQEKINSIIKDTGKQVELVKTRTDEHGKSVTEVNKEYESQLRTIKAIEREKQLQNVNALKEAAEAKANEKVGTTLDYNWFKRGTIYKALRDAVVDTSSIAKNNHGYSEMGSGGDYEEDLSKAFNELDFDKQYQTLKKWREELVNAQGDSKKYANAISEIDTKLSDMEKQAEEANTAIEAYNDALKELYSESENLSEYSDTLSAIMKNYGKNEKIKGLVSDLQNLNKNFQDGKVTTQEYFDGLQQKINEIDFSNYKKQLNSEETKKQLEENKDTIIQSSIEMGLSAEEAESAYENLITKATTLTEEETNELQGYQSIFAETTRYIAESLEEIQNSYDDGEITFKDYNQSLIDTNDSLLQLYAKENDLHYVQNEGWANANDEIDYYATNLQEIQDQAESFIGVLDSMAESYDYIAENADAFGNAAFTASNVADEAYQNLATNFTASLNQMKDTNEEAFNAITDKVIENSGITANELLDSNGYITNAFNTNNKALNVALNEAARQSQEAAKKLATSTGTLISNLGKAIANFKYNIDFDVSGSIEPGGNILNLATGKSFKPTSNLRLSVSGSPGARSSVADLAKSLQDWGSDYNNYITSSSDYKSLIDTIKPYVSKNTSGYSGGKEYSSRTPSSSSGSGGNKKSYSSKTSNDEAKAEEEAYKKRLEAFKNYVSDKEALEQRWVSKQKELGQLGTKDFLYITQERIKRYQQYLDEIKKATWINEEDRLALEKTYSEKIEDLQLDYIGYLKDKLDEEIEAIKTKNQKKEQLIKDNAQKQIDALKKVENENTRIRKQEEYEQKRKEHLDDISYWQQRTGREAQENLKTAKKNLEELDKEWKQQKEDWSLEDQITEIENRRDAEIAAIEAEQEKEIAALQAIYDEKVKLFSETGQIIYEDSIIQSKALYKQYKDLFIDPIASELDKIRQANTVATPSPTKSTSSEPEKKYEDYTIRYGDTLTSIARKFGTTIEKIMEANPYITNKNRIYSGKTLQIPKFHEGGIVGGNNKEGYALLKSREVVLKPEWAASLNRMMKYFDGVTMKGLPIASNGPKIEVKGDLVKVNANIQNRNDADYLTKQIEKMLKDKFNIKK